MFALLREEESVRAIKLSLIILLVTAGIFAISAVVLYSCGGGGGSGGVGAMRAVPAPVSTVQAVDCPASSTTDVTIVNMTVGFHSTLPDNSPDGILN